MFQILALCLDFEGEKNINFFEVLIWGFGGHWRFPTGVWHLDLELNMVIGFLLYPFSEFWLPILILKVQRTLMSFKSSF